MNAEQFAEKWRRVALTERSAAQSHYLDLCEVFAFPKPTDEDPTGTSYTFEKKVDKLAGGRGFADVWRRQHFAWKYKKKHKDLEAAFDQLLQYIGNLENPPLLVACDMDRIVVRTHFTGYPSVRHEVTLDKFTTTENLELLRLCPRRPDPIKWRVGPDGGSHAPGDRRISTRISERPDVHG